MSTSLAHFVCDFHCVCVCFFFAVFGSGFLCAFVDLHRLVDSRRESNVAAAAAAVVFAQIQIGHGRVEGPLQSLYGRDIAAAAAAAVARVSVVSRLFGGV